jgi:hypothetical protein
MTGGTMTRSATYSTVDVGNVVRRLKADLLMMGDSTGLWTPQKAADYAYDVEELAKKDYLSWVDVTLINAFGQEITAVRYDVTTSAGALTSSRPGGVLWPKTPGGQLRMIIGYTDDYDSDARRTMSDKLRIGWTTTYDDYSHSNLTRGDGRDYTSNAFGMTRKDWSK